IDQQPKARVPSFYAACDLGLVVLRDAPLFQEVLPSKIFEYLAMERPIVCNVGGDARQLVEVSAGGVCVPAGNVAALAEAIRRLSQESDRLRAMGKAGRQFVVQHYDRKRQARAYLEILQETCRPNATPCREKAWTAGAGAAPHPGKAVAAVTG